MYLASLLITLLSGSGLLCGWYLRRTLRQLKVLELANDHLRTLVNRQNMELLQLKNSFDARLKAEEDVTWNAGFFQGIVSRGIALRTANGRFSTREAFFSQRGK